MWKDKLGRGSDSFKVTQLVMSRMVIKVLMSWSVFYYISRFLFLGLLMFRKMNELLILKVLIADNGPMSHFIQRLLNFNPLLLE